MSGIQWRDLSFRENTSQRTSHAVQIQRRTNLYDVLEVSCTASPEVIKAAYRALMEKYHPDKHPECRRAWAEEISRRLNQAYATLRHPQKRRDYDYANGVRTGA